MIDFYIEERLMRAFCSNMSFSYATFKTDIRQVFSVLESVKKDLLAKTEGPPMRVSTIKLTAHTETVDVAILKPISLVPA
jgi:hypothetical protein